MGKRTVPAGSTRRRPEGVRFGCACLGARARTAIRPCQYSEAPGQAVASIQSRRMSCLEAYGQAVASREEPITT